jgi:hypothetical protein
MASVELGWKMHGGYRISVRIDTQNGCTVKLALSKLAALRKKVTPSLGPLF